MRAFLHSPALAGRSRTGQYVDGLDLLGLTGSSEILEEFPDGRWFPIFRRFGSNAHFALEESDVSYMHQIFRGLPVYES